MSSVNKELLEDLVVNTTLQLLSSDEVITKIAKSVYKVHEEANRNDAVLKSLESKRGSGNKSVTKLDCRDRTEHNYRTNEDAIKGTRNANISIRFRYRSGKEKNLRYFNHR